MGIEYDPPGPQALAFHQSDAFVRGLRGPVGSGKSSSCCMEIFTRALAQKASPDGKRRSRWAAIRNTYGELKSTTIKTWEDWFTGLSVMKWDTPIVSTISMPDLGDGTSLELEVLFLALDRPDDVKKLKSLELTGAWMNEASELEKAVLDMCTQRVGRYPSKHLHGGSSWSGVIMDTNPPDDDSWWYVLAEKDASTEANAKMLESTKEAEEMLRAAGMLRADQPLFEFFAQPGGLYRVMDKESPDFGKYKPNPAAENIRNLSDGYSYYLKQLAGKKDAYITVFLLGQYGSTLNGKPVYADFNEALHVSEKPLFANPGLPLILAFDFGLTPACVIGQMSPKGQLQIFDEIIGEDMGIRNLYVGAVLPILNAKYSGFRIEAVGDPAGVSRSDTDEKSCFEELEECGLICEPASSNKWTPRRDSVEFFLTRLTSAGAGIVIDKRCPVLIKGFRGGYMYERLQVTGHETLYKDRPRKNKYSHPHDGLQYLCLHARGDNGTRAVAQEVQQVAWA
jgi:hypothetical protein